MPQRKATPRSCAAQGADDCSGSAYEYSFPYPPAVLEHLRDALRRARRAVALDRLVAHRRMQRGERSLGQLLGRQARISDRAVGAVVGEPPAHVQVLLEMPLERE